MKDIIIIGAGVVGCFLAHHLSKYHLKVLVLEKGDDVASSASMANSAIIHSGYDPDPGSEKARLNVAGNAKYDQICRDLDVPFKRIGSLTLAKNEEELETLKELAHRAKANGVAVTILNQEEVRALEPQVSNTIVGALLASTAGIIDPFLLCAHLMEHALDGGVRLQLNEEVIRLSMVDGSFKVETPKNCYQSRLVINAAGVHCHQVTSLLETPPYQVTPRKGEYFVLNHFAPDFVNHVLFTLPSAKGKGVLISPTTAGNYLVGPSSEPSAMDDRATDEETLNQVRQQALEMVPSLPLQETIRVFAGVRPTIDRHDFWIRESQIHPGFMELAGIESPGLASAPAISEEVIKRLAHYLTLRERSDYVATIRPYRHLAWMSEEERRNLIKQEPRYGRIVCRCEQVSEQEIRDLFDRSFPPQSVKAIKKRVRAGFGLCQGGMCQPLVVALMAELLQMDRKTIRYDGYGSEILKYDSREAHDE